MNACSHPERGNEAKPIPFKDTDKRANVRAAGARVLAAGLKETRSEDAACATASAALRTSAASRLHWDAWPPRRAPSHDVTYLALAAFWS